MADGTAKKPTACDLNRLYRRLYEHYGASGWWPALYGGAFEIVCGAILTQNTAWRNVETALTRMRERDLWSWRALRQADAARLEDAVKPSGYYRVKAKKLKVFAEAVEVEYGGDLQKMFALTTPRLRRRLLNIWGIGPETADDIILYAAGKPTFVIDRYTMRLVDRLGWRVEGKGYDAYKALFETLLKPDLNQFQEYHGLIDMHAARICKMKPKCAECCLKDLCDYAKVKSAN